MPDQKYRERVDVSSLALPPWPSDETVGGLAPLRQFLDTAAHLLALENARTVVRARLMGARMAGDEEALGQQLESYQRIERDMGDTAQRLEHLLPDVQRAIDEDPRFEPDRLNEWIDALSQSGFSEAMYKAMVDAKIDHLTIHSIWALFRDVQVVELLRANGPMLVPFVVSLKYLVSEVNREREAVLAGESYVHAPKRSNVTAENGSLSNVRI